jgi:hypothetical protein
LKLYMYVKIKTIKIYYFNLIEVSIHKNKK